MHVTITVSLRFTLVFWSLGQYSWRVYSPSCHIAPKAFSYTISTSTLTGCTHLYPWVKKCNYCRVSCSRTQVTTGIRTHTPWPYSFNQANNWVQSVITHWSVRVVWFALKKNTSWIKTTCVCQEQGVVHMGGAWSEMYSTKESLTACHIHAGRPENVVNAHRILK